MSINCSVGGTSICRDIWMCHYFEYFFEGAAGFLGIFWLIPRFLGIIFFVKFDLFWNDPDFWVLILIFDK